MTEAQADKRRSLLSIEWLNFFLADVQTGLGPFLAAYLASSGWNAGSVGYALTFGGVITVAMQTPAGAVVDALHRKRGLIAAGLGVLVAGAFLLMGRPNTWSVYSAQTLIGGSAPFLGPTVAAITLGVVGAAGFDRQFGTNQSFNSAGNVPAALSAFRRAAWIKLSRASAAGKSSPYRFLGRRRRQSARKAEAALKTVYRPGGFNVGINISHCEISAMAPAPVFPVICICTCCRAGPVTSTS